MASAGFIARPETVTAVAAPDGITACEEGRRFRSCGALTGIPPLPVVVEVSWKRGRGKEFLFIIYQGVKEGAVILLLPLVLCS